MGLIYVSEDEDFDGETGMVAGYKASFVFQISTKFDNA